MQLLSSSNGKWEDLRAVSCCQSHHFGTAQALWTLPVYTESFERFRCLHKWVLFLGAAAKLL